MFFFGRSNSILHYQKPDRRATNSFQFFDTLEIAPPHDHKIAFSFQRHLLINSLIGNHQCTYYSIERALTISNFYFSCSCGRSYKTLATRGLEKLFSSCAVVSVFCSSGK